MLFAKISSYLFHPIFMTIIGVFIIFNSGIYSTGIPTQFSHYVYLMVFLCNVLLPLTLISSLIIFKKIKNEIIEEKQERLIPLIFTTICFYFCYYMVSRLSPSVIINLFLGSAVVVLVAVLIITVFWKISMHLAGIGGITGLTLFLIHFYNADILLILSILILITGIVATSRLALGSHSIFQLIGGYFLGLVLVFGFLIKMIA
jgi:hypothetical protein